MSAEDKLQNSIIKYVLFQYNVTAIPNNTEGKKTPFERYKFEFMGGRKGVLDLFVPIIAGGYGGLFLELKPDGRKVFKKNGDVLKNDTLIAQNKTIKKLLQQGYYATFAVGFDQTKEIIDKYVKGEIMPENY